MIVTFEYLGVKNGRILATVKGRIRLTEKRIFVEEQVGNIDYRMKIGTTQACVVLQVSEPKVFDRGRSLESRCPFLACRKVGGWLPVNSNELKRKCYV